MTPLLIVTAVIAFVVGCLAAVLSLSDKQRGRTWMWFTPLWSAPIVLTIILVARATFGDGMPNAGLGGGDARVTFAFLLSLIWVPAALVGWTFGRGVWRPR